jgi:hypothetical protein
VTGPAADDVAVPIPAAVRAVDADAPVEPIDVLGGPVHEYRRTA